LDSHSLLKLTLRAGSVYYFQERRPSSPEPHYFIVVNHEPFARQLLVLTIITSRVEYMKRLRQGLPGTVVEIRPKDYDELKGPSVVDCNVVFNKALSELAEKIQRKEVVYKRDLPSAILQAIRQGIKASPLIETEIKRLLDQVNHERACHFTPESAPGILRGSAPFQV